MKFIIPILSATLLAIVLFLRSPIEGTEIRTFDLYFGRKLESCRDLETIKWAIIYFGNRSHEKFVYFVSRAAHLGDANYQMVYGDILLKEYEDLDGIDWLEKSVEGGWDFSLYKMGKIYEKGIVVDVNYERARFYYERAVERNILESKLKLAEFYISGYGGDLNYVKARELLSETALSNNPSYAYDVKNLLDKIPQNQ